MLLTLFINYMHIQILYISDRLMYHPGFLIVYFIDSGETELWGKGQYLLYVYNVPLSNGMIILINPYN